LKLHSYSCKRNRTPKMNLHFSKELESILIRCSKKDKKAQYELFKVSSSYAMSISLRYANGQDEANEILTDSFLKVFNSLDKFDPTQSFAAWLRKIVVRTAIDKYRQQQKLKQLFVNIDLIEEEPEVENILGKFDAEDILDKIQALSPAYRLVFSLYAVEGYSHKEIAEQLGITESTSKSNYHKAKLHLQKALLHSTDFKKASYER